MKCVDEGQWKGMWLADPIGAVALGLGLFVVLIPVYAQPHAKEGPLCTELQSKRRRFGPRLRGSGTSPGRYLVLYLRGFRQKAFTDELHPTGFVTAENVKPQGETVGERLSQLDSEFNQRAFGFFFRSFVRDFYWYVRMAIDRPCVTRTGTAVSCRLMPSDAASCTTE